MQCLHLYDKIRFPKWLLLTIGFCGVILQGILLYRWIDTPFGQNLSASHIFSLISWEMIILTLFCSIQKPIENLMIFILPLASLSILCSLAWPGQVFIRTRLHPGGLAHILLSVLAFSTLGLALMQAGLLHIQNRLLRIKHFTPMFRILPPLQTMETLFFQILWLGFVLLSSSLGSAFLFYDNLSSPLRLQKIIFSFLAWALFATLIYGHYRSGLRGVTAVRWTLIGMVLLSFAYFGSKLIFLQWN